MTDQANLNHNGRMLPRQPTYEFRGDFNTGMYHSAANNPIGLPQQVIHFWNDLNTGIYRLAANNPVGPPAQARVIGRPSPAVRNSYRQ